MKISLFLFSLILLRVTASAADVVIYGGTPGGIASAIAAARMGPGDAIYAEFEALAAAHPDRARVITQPYRTLEGREVKGIEVWIGNPQDGRPVSYYDGCHHAREWPSADYCRLFAHHLLNQTNTFIQPCLQRRSRRAARCRSAVYVAPRFDR